MDKAQTKSEVLDYSLDDIFDLDSLDPDGGDKNE